MMSADHYCLEVAAAAVVLDGHPRPLLCESRELHSSVRWCLNAHVLKERDQFLQTFDCLRPGDKFASIAEASDAFIYPRLTRRQVHE